MNNLYAVLGVEEDRLMTFHDSKKGSNALWRALVQIEEQVSIKTRGWVPLK